MESDNPGLHLFPRLPGYPFSRRKPTPKCKHLSRVIVVSCPENRFKIYGVFTTLKMWKPVQDESFKGFISIGWMSGFLKGGEVLELVYVTKQNAISDQKPRLISIKTTGAKNVIHSKMLSSLNNHQKPTLLFRRNLSWEKGFSLKRLPQQAPVESLLWISSQEPRAWSSKECPPCASPSPTSCLSSLLFKQCSFRENVSLSYCLPRQSPR